MNFLLAKKKILNEFLTKNFLKKKSLIFFRNLQLYFTLLLYYLQLHTLENGGGKIILIKADVYA
jgi:hypothetical protein